jgi:hypothetical protein
MRLAEDIVVSRATTSWAERVDLLLGGHDHHVVRRTFTDTDRDPTHVQQGVPDQGAAVTDYEGDVRVVKSGTDWRGLSIVRLIIERRPSRSACELNVKSVKSEDHNLNTFSELIRRSSKTNRGPQTNAKLPPDPSMPQNPGHHIKDSR